MEVEHLEANKKKRPWNDQTVLATEESLTELEQGITDLERQPQKKAKSPSAMAFTTTDDIPAGTLTLTLTLITNLHDGHCLRLVWSGLVLFRLVWYGLVSSGLVSFRLVTSRLELKPIPHEIILGYPPPPETWTCQQYTDLMQESSNYVNPRTGATWSKIIDEITSLNDFEQYVRNNWATIYEEKLAKMAASRLDEFDARYKMAGEDINANTIVDELGRPLQVESYLKTVRELFEDGAYMGENFWEPIVIIFIERLPLVFNIFDGPRERIGLLRDVCIILVIAIQCHPEKVSSAIDTRFRHKLAKIGSCVEVPDFQIQSIAIEILKRMDKYIPEDTLKEALPSQLRRHWSRLREPNTFWEQVRLVLNDYNSYEAVHHPQMAMFSLKARKSVTTFKGSKANFDLNLEWLDVGVSSITCTADLKDGQDAEPMEFFFRNVRDAKFLSESNVFSLELQFVCNELSYFLKQGCNCETDEKTVHFLTVNLDIDKNVATTFKTEFHDRCRLSPYFATHSTYSTASSEKVCIHTIHPST